MPQTEARELPLLRSLEFMGLVWKLRVVAVISLTSPQLHKYKESYWCASWQNWCGPKPVSVGAASCFPSFLAYQLSGQVVTPPVGHFCGVIWGIFLKVWLKACSSPCQQPSKYPIPALNPFPLKLVRMDSLIYNWTLTNPGGIYKKHTYGCHLEMEE